MVFVGIVVAVSLLALVSSGCSVGSGIAGGTGVDPVELEIRSRIQSFAAAISEKNITKVEEHLDSNLQFHYSHESSPQGLTFLRTRLNSFFQKTAAVTVLFPDEEIDILPGGEGTARFRGQMICVYTRLSDGVTMSFVENWEIGWEQEIKWGIKVLSGFNLEKLSFPPVLQ